MLAQHSVTPFPGRASDDYPLIGASVAMATLREQIAAVAVSDAPVLVTGPTGSGKELIARALHRHLDPESPFVAINCAAIPEALIESELFGHESGSFTGAQGRRIGCFEAANGGTLFLDEIGDMRPDLQARLLRAVAEKQVVRVGGSKPIAVNARLVSATHRDLGGAAMSAAFRQDLYFRLAVLAIEVSPLVDRRSDVPGVDRPFPRRCEHIKSAALHALGNGGDDGL